MKPSRSGSARRRRVAVAPRARSRRPAGSASAAAIQFLEERVMLSGLALTELPVAAFGGAADPQTSVHGGACCCPGCMPYFQGDTTGAAAVSGTSGAPPFPLTETFRLHSLPGANFTIYLDFDGHTTSGTQWNVDFNAGADIVSPAFSIDSNFSDFNSLEREYIQRVWQRVAEDFAPFNVDVTTEDPGVERLRRSGPGDAQWGVRSIQTDDQSFLLDDIGFLIGGIAYLGSFQWNSDTPVFTFNGSGSTSLFDEMAAADTHSHEVGHSLGLSHDGRTSPLEEYYGGHGSPLDPTSWAPIMGAFFADGSDNQLTQWSRGEYPNASQTQDDLRIITDPSLNGAGWGYSGLSYRADDHGNTTSGATALTVLGTSLTGSGLIEQGSDRDVFAFDAVAGQYTFDFRPYDRGPNLDILAELLDASGRVVASSNPVNALSASVTAFLTAGRYYLRVDGTGKPAAGSDFGYSDYGSLGWYTIDGVLDFAEDAYDENDTRTTAADPRGNGGQWEQTWLSAINGPGIANDEDWYVIDVTPGYLRVVAELDYNYADGDIDLGLWDANGREVAFSEDQDDDERIDFVVSAAGRYYLRVYSYFPYRATPYDLRWDDLLTGTPLVPTVGVSVSPASVAENGGSGLVFTFTRSAVGEPLKVDFGVGGTAALGTDYTQTGAVPFTATAGSVAFSSGATTATVTVTPNGDSLVERAETVVLTLIDRAGYDLGSAAAATGTIANDDSATLAVADASVVEGDSGTRTLVFTVTLSRAVDAAVSVSFATADGTATAGGDYDAASGTLIFAAGETSKTVSVTVHGDTAVEPDETLELALSALSAAGRDVTLGRARATGTVTNDDFDPPPAVTGVRFGYGNGRWVTTAELGTRVTAPWRITRIEVTFDRDVLVDVADLVVTGAAGTPLALSGFTYDAGTRVAVWTLATPVERDRLTVVVDGDGAGADGNDGVRAASGVYPPGGGYLAGGDSASNLDVLFGDVSGDGKVDLLDMLLVRGRNGTTDRWADVNGDGIVDLLDILLVRGRNGTALP